MRLFTALLAAALCAPFGLRAQSPPAAAAPSFSIGDTLHFVFVEGSVAPAGRNQAEITATFRVENRGAAPVSAGVGAARFRGAAAFPITRIDGMHVCPPQAECRRAQATVFTPGSATPIRLTARVALTGTADPKVEALRQFQSIDLYIEVVRVFVPGEAGYTPRASFLPPQPEQTFQTSMNFADHRAVIRNTMPGAQ